MKWILIAATSVLLASCAAMEFRSPVSGKIGGATAFGYTTARLQGDSTFTVDTTAGLRCDGIYDATAGGMTITAKATCSDGRTGEIAIQRKGEGGLGGIAIGTLSDGTKGQFVFGKDVRYDEEFPGPDETAPKNVTVQKPIKKKR